MNNNIPSEKEVLKGLGSGLPPYRTWKHSGTSEPRILSTELFQPKMGSMLDELGLINHNIAIFKSIKAEKKWCKWLVKNGYTVEVVSSVVGKDVERNWVSVVYATKGDFLFYDISAQSTPLRRKAKQIGGGCVIWTGGSASEIRTPKLHRFRQNWNWIQCLTPKKEH